MCICWCVKMQFSKKNSSDLIVMLSHYISTQSLPQTTDIILKPVFPSTTTASRDESKWYAFNLLAYRRVTIVRSLWHHRFCSGMGSAELYIVIRITPVWFYMSVTLRWGLKKKKKFCDKVLTCISSQQQQPGMRKGSILWYSVC